MPQTNSDADTEWIFCRVLDGECSGISPNTAILEKIPKTIIVHGKKVDGWMVKIQQEKSEGHVNLNLENFSDE